MEPHRISTIDQLDAALQADDPRPLLLFKHSTRCPVSSWAHNAYHRFVDRLDPGEARPAIVYVVEDRPVSDAAADRLQVRHESPQAFVIAAGEVVWHDSHSGITEEALTDALTRARTVA